MATLHGPRPGRNAPLILVALACILAFPACENESSCPTCPQGRTVFYGNLTVDSQAGVDALAGVETWIGSLRVTGSNINNLRGLGSLKRVTGQLGLYVPAVDNFAPLSSLVEVERLSVDDGGRVTSLAPLSRIEGCVNLAISQCDSLEHLPTGNLFADARYITISDCPLVTSLEPLASAVAATDLTLRNLPSVVDLGDLAALPLLEELHLVGFEQTSLPDLTGLTGLRQLNLQSWNALVALDGVSGYPNLEELSLRSCHSLVSLNGLTDCPGLSRITLSSCDSLATLDGLADLPLLESLSIFDCDRLPSLAGLGSLPKISTVEVRYCDAFASLEGAAAIPSLKMLSLDVLPALVDLASMPTTIALDHALIGDCEELVSLAGLRLERGALLQIRYCRNLADLQGFAVPDSLDDLTIQNTRLDDLRGFEPVRNIRFLNLSSNALTSVDGLQGLRKLASGMSIEHNDQLTDLSALAAIDSIGVAGVEIRDNPRLNNCIVQVMASGWNVEGSVVIKDNGPCAR